MPQTITRYSTGTPNAIDIKLDKANSRTEPNINWLGPVSHENILWVPSPKRLRVYSPTVLTRERRQACAKKTYPNRNAGTARNIRKTPITPCRYAKPAPPVNVQTEKPDMNDAIPATHHSTRLPPFRKSAPTRMKRMKYAPMPAISNR